jgi:hypothetical protein
MQMIELLKRPGLTWNRNLLSLDDDGASERGCVTTGGKGKHLSGTAAAQALIGGFGLSEEGSGQHPSA